MRAAWLVVVVVVVLGCGAPELAPSTVRQPIIGGVADAQHAAVGAVLADGLGYCSGTLVSPRAVLTAGHCAELFGAGPTYTVRFDSTGSVVRRQVKHPRYTTEGAPFDVALLDLERAVPVPPMGFVRRAPPGLAVDAGLVHVGFGATQPDGLAGDGTRRSVAGRVAKLDADFLYSGDARGNTCSGDSGGAALFALPDGGEALVGVVSDGPSCTEPGWDVRVDVVSGWIAQTVVSFGDAPPVDPDSPEGDAPRGCASVGGATGLGLLVFLRNRRVRARSVRGP